MNYRRDKHQSSPLIVPIVSVVLIVLIYTTPLLSWVSQITHRLFSGALTVPSTVQENITQVNSLVTLSRAEMTDAYTRLFDAYENMSFRMQDYQRVVQENAELRALVQAPRSERILVATSRVLEHPPVSPYHTLVLDTGSRDGVMVGDGVFIGGVWYLGDVAEVFPRTSVVRLVTDYTTVREIRVVRTGNIFQLSGRNGVSGVLEIPREVDIVEGDQLIDVRSNALALVVYKVTITDQEPFQTVYVRMGHPLQDISLVSIMRYE